MGFRASAEQAVQLLRDHFVAFAGSGFEPLAIEDGQPAPVVGNQPALLEFARHGRHGRAAHAEHLGQELLGKLELVSPHPVVAHQQPAAHAFLDRVRVVADRGLRNLVNHRLGVTLDQAIQRANPASSLPERTRFPSAGPLPRNLQKWPPGRGLLWDPRKTGVPTIPSLPMVPTSRLKPPSMMMTRETTPLEREKNDAGILPFALVEDLLRRVRAHLSRVGRTAWSYSLRGRATSSRFLPGTPMDSVKF